MISAAIDGLISLVLGLWITLIGFKVTSLSDDQAKAEEFARKWGFLFKIAGPIIVLWGLYSLMRIYEKTV